MGHVFAMTPNMQSLTRVASPQILPAPFALAVQSAVSHAPQLYAHPALQTTSSLQEQ